jgi:hypothetical protein
MGGCNVLSILLHPASGRNVDNDNRAADFISRPWWSSDRLEWNAHTDLVSKRNIHNDVFSGGMIMEPANKQKVQKKGAKKPEEEQEVINATVFMKTINGGAVEGKNIGE